MKEYMLDLGKKAKEAARQGAILSSDKKDRALKAMAAALKEETEEILAANALDMKAAEEKGTGSAMLDRLRLDESRIEAMASGL